MADALALLREQEPNKWIPVGERLPEDQVTVLAVKRLKSGRLDICLARCIRAYRHYDYVTGQDVTEPYWVTGGNNNIICWQPLPAMPEE